MLISISIIAGNSVQDRDNAALICVVLAEGAPGPTVWGYSTGWCPDDLRLDVADAAVGDHVGACHERAFV